jgi:hypothetical protein
MCPDEDEGSHGNWVEYVGKLSTRYVGSIGMSFEQEIDTLALLDSGILALKAMIWDAM